MSTRTKSISPFPSAYKVICDFEIDCTPTKVWTPSQDLLDACKRNEYVCSGCGELGEVDYDWSMAVILNEDGDSTQRWYCKLCFHDDTKEPAPYAYKGNGLDNAEETPFRQSKKT